MDSVIRLKTITQTFNITPEILENRKRVSIYIESFASLIVDRFYDYLLANSIFEQNLDKEQLPLLKKMRVELLVSLFCDEFDEHLVDKISLIQSQSPIKLNSYIIASSFELLQEAVIDISSVNNEIQQDLKTILKFLRIAELIAHDDSQITRENDVKQKTNLVWVLETLFEMLSIHKTKSELLIKTWEEGKLKEPYLEVLPVKDVMSCQFYEIMTQLKEKEKEFKVFNLEIDKIEEFHFKYHEEVNIFYNLVENNTDYKIQETQIQKIKETSNELFEHIGKPYEQTSSLAFLSVNSGMRFIQRYNAVINETKFIPFNNSQKLLEFIEKLIITSMEKSLSWIVLSSHISDTKPQESYDINEEITLASIHIYIGLKIKDIPYKSFIFDIIKVFLQILKTSIINREKEYSLTALAQKAESANRSKDMFLANMSHELRTPLNAIIGFSQILQVRPEIPDTMKPYIDKIAISGNNLLTLVNTILDFAKLEAGKIAFHPKVEFLSSVVKEISVILSPMASAKNITLVLPEDISLVLYIDAQLIKQSLINLLTNAIKFTPEGGEVRFSISFDEQKKEYILSICDNGVGMSAEGLSQLFTPFTQIDNGMQANSKGTGLGLVITKRIIEDLHQGEIWVESEQNKGTCFHFSLPLKDEILKIEYFESQNEDAQKVLVVEDSQEYVDILVEKLSTKYHLSVTNSISKAKELLQSNEYSKIVLDFFLVDGISSELLTFMRLNSINTPIYMISAEDDFKLVQHIEEADNMVGIFNKNDINLICDTLLRT